MPEYPDITIYIERLDALLRDQPLRDLRIVSPFLLRTADPPVETLVGRTIIGFRRMGKRIVFCFDPDLYGVLHLMIAGRLHWKPPGERIPPRRGLCAFDFDHGTLLLTEAGTKKRASLHVVRGRADLDRLELGGLEVFEIAHRSAALQRHRECLLRRDPASSRTLAAPAQPEDDR